MFKFESLNRGVTCPFGASARWAAAALGVLTWMGESGHGSELVCFLQNPILQRMYAHSILCPLHGKGASGLVAGEVVPACIGRWGPGP